MSPARFESPAPSGRGRGLSASELALASAELAKLLLGAAVKDVSPIQGGDDLLLVLLKDDRRIHLHVALGQERARIGVTTRRFRNDEFQPGPRTDVLKKHLVQARVTGIEHETGERRLELHVSTSAGQPLRLVVELFSVRGLWALCTEGGTVLALSRQVTTAVRSLETGSRYTPPPKRAATGPQEVEPPPRFSAPVLDAIDAHFAPADFLRSLDADKTALQLACDRAIARVQKKQDGLNAQRQEASRAPLLRAEADLMLAYMQGVPRGALSMTVPDPDGDGERVIELDPSLPLQVQVRARYDRARRLDDGRAIAEQRLQATETELAALRSVREQLEHGPSDEDALASIRQQLSKLSALPKAAPQPATAGTKSKKSKSAVQKGDNVRRYVSVEGYEILVGRDNQQNDRLTLRIAKGNDLWLHVGGGRPGSHVVVRLPKGKTASLDTLLDAGTLAVHFSKARGERSIEVIYTFAKNVRKPKGLPAGAVVPSQTKTITVRLDEDRKKRLLDSTIED